MSGEPARRRALRLRQSAHCLLPSLEPSPPIAVRLGRSRPIGGPGVIGGGHDHSIWIRRIHRNAHDRIHRCARAGRGRDRNVPEVHKPSLFGFLISSYPEFNFKSPASTSTKQKENLI